eukprot:TRINITY_DN12560_c0_g3_i1.p1 TRINITY_DN12560_c0_g3~~TRINITY_DN12560_c0_g3_i1.p1  ORF type:complete len:138 (+),score=28.89 TRINITY_DN12560_c0_g3_i1:1072-1485(+)
MWTNNFREREYWKSHESPFPSLLHHLKNVTIFGFMGEKQVIEYESDLVGGSFSYREKWKGEVKLVKFLLETAMVLEKMKIYISKRLYSNAKEESEVSRSVRERLGFPRAASLQKYHSYPIEQRSVVDLVRRIFSPVL